MRLFSQLKTMLVGVFFYVLLRSTEGLDRLEDWIEKLLASGYDPFLPPAKAFGGRNSSTRSVSNCLFFQRPLRLMIALDFEAGRGDLRGEHGKLPAEDNGL